jgi:hypothetical protein
MRMVMFTPRCNREFHLALRMSTLSEITMVARAALHTVIPSQLGFGRNPSLKSVVGASVLIRGARPGGPMATTQQWPRSRVCVTLPAHASLLATSILTMTCLPGRVPSRLRGNIRGGRAFGLGREFATIPQPFAVAGGEANSQRRNNQPSGLPCRIDESTIANVIDQAWMIIACWRNQTVRAQDQRAHTFERRWHPIHRAEISGDGDCAQPLKSCKPADVT